MERSNELDPTLLPATDAATNETVHSVAGTAATTMTLTPGTDDTLSAPAATGSAHGAYPGFVTVDRAHYVIGEQIARGGMGRIFTAHDRRLDRPVAIKELLVQDAGLAARFEREARLTARLQHPSIVSIHEAGRWPSGEPFLAMKLVVGRTLEAALAGKRTLADRIAHVPNVLAAVDALAFAHARRIVHRDLKPGNILLGDFGETVVIDWGLAKDLDAVDDTETSSPSRPNAGETVAGAILGTPAYMPPEQAKGESVDERADVYALGAILYHVLSGGPPVDGSTITEVLSNVVTDVPRPLRTHAPDVPGELITIVEKAMARELEDRYPNAGALATDLRAYQAGQLVGSHRYSMPQLVRRWIAKHRAVVTTVATAGVVAIILGTVAIRRIVDEKRAAEVAKAEAIEQRSNAESSLATATTERGRAEELFDFLLGDLKQQLESIDRVDILDATLERATTYYTTRASTSDPDVLRRHALAVGERARSLGARGKLAEARVLAQEALALSTKGLALRPDDAALFFIAARARSNLALFDESPSVTLAAYKRLVADVEAFARAHPPSATEPARQRIASDLIRWRAQLARRAARTGDLDLARAQASLAITAAEQEYARAPSDVRTVTALAEVRAANAEIFLPQLDVESALTHQREVVSLLEAFVQEHPYDLRALDAYVAATERLGDYARVADRLDEALAAFQRSMPVRERLRAASPLDPDKVTSLAAGWRRIGGVERKRGNLEAAELSVTKAVTMLRELARSEEDADVREALAIALDELGHVLIGRKQKAQAQAIYREALGVIGDLAKLDEYRAIPLRVRVHLGFASVTSHAEAIVSLRAAVELATKDLARAPDSADKQDDLATVKLELADELARDPANAAEAIRLLDAALATYEDLMQRNKSARYEQLRDEAKRARSALVR